LVGGGCAGGVHLKKGWSMGLKLVPEVRRAWRWFSVQAMTLAGSLQAAWLAVPDDLRIKVPGVMVHVITIALLVAGIVGRLVQQSSKDGK